jgi:peroxiredoxin
MRRTWMSLVAGFALAGFAVAEPDGSSDKLGTKIDPPLVDGTGKSARLADLAGEKATVVFFVSFDCPNSNGYTPTLIDLHKEYAGKGVKFVAVCETDLSADELKAKIDEYKLPFPILTDPKQATADAFKAKTTPEAFVLDHNRVMRYRGRIDNMFSDRLKRNPKVTDYDLKNAIDDVVAGNPVRTPVTKAVGCPIGGRDAVVKSATTVTFHKDVLPILQKNCQACHRPDEVGPFALMTYKQTVAWAEDIKEFTASRKMPPWKPSAGKEFLNERRLSDGDIKTLTSWVDGGTPEGDTKEAPPPVKWDNDWRLGKPDLVLEPADDFHIGPSGPDTFRCYVLPTDLPDDKYIIGYEVKPGNPQVVHHTLNYWNSTGKARKLELDAKEKAKPEDRDRGPGYSVAMGVGFFPGPSGRPDVAADLGNFGGWAPGSMYRFLPEGTGYLLPKGADVILQVHYHRNGKPEKDRTKIGLYFAKKPVERPYQTIVLGPRNPLFLNIPAGKEDHKIEGTIYLHSDCTMHSVMPHMHLIGKSIKVTMTPPGGQTTTLVEIKEWDYNWQETYWFKEPLKLKAGTRLDIEGIYDNSSKNPNNPRNPPAVVLFGEQTTNEMLFGFFGVTSADKKRVIARQFPPGAKEK